MQSKSCTTRIYQRFAFNYSQLMSIAFSKMFKNGKQNAPYIANREKQVYIILSVCISSLCIICLYIYHKIRLYSLHLNAENHFFWWTLLNGKICLRWILLVCSIFLFFFTVFQGSHTHIWCVCYLVRCMQLLYAHRCSTLYQRRELYCTPPNHARRIALKV